MLSIKTFLSLSTLLLPALADVTLIASSGTLCNSIQGFPKVLSLNECVGIDDAFSSLAIASAGSYELNNPKCELRFYTGNCNDTAGNYVQISPIKQANGLCIVPEGGKTIAANTVVAKLICPSS
ncbi:MAG: hypothetical protein M1836_002054 [Candelina mexicana]|nr:MAG: hypothetical protein M1836_002054 [Candelina mexicana]